MKIFSSYPQNQKYKKLWQNLGPFDLEYFIDNHKININASIPLGILILPGFFQYEG